MVNVVEKSTTEVELRHLRLTYLGAVVAVLLVASIGWLIDGTRRRVHLTCYRHETDPTVEIEDIDCILVRDSAKISFELGQVSVQQVLGRSRRVGGNDKPRREMFEVHLHKKFPADADTIPFFRFQSRVDAEEAKTELMDFVEDALISDDDVDEIEVQFGPPSYSRLIGLMGAFAIVLALTQPCMEVATFDGGLATFRLVRWNGLGVRTFDVTQPLDTVARLSVSDRMVAATTGNSRVRSIQKAQSLAVVFRSWGCAHSHPHRCIHARTHLGTGSHRKASA